MTKKKTPELIDDKDLDQASGGIGLLLPAVQKVREAAATQSSPAVSEIVVTKTIDKASPQL
jgi:hypothetical protein